MTFMKGPHMRFGIMMPAFEDFADPRLLMQTAREAEAAGWDGLFLWDHLMNNGLYAVADPWVALAAVATATTTIRIGTMVTPLARRRPWKLARELVTLDQLSNGRVILAVGLGEPPHEDFGAFGEDPGAKVRAEKLDEGLTILDGLLRGEPVRFQGMHYDVDRVAFRPTPVQTPRIPIWVGGMFPNPAPLRRAARWDGYAPIKPSETGMMLEDWDKVREVIAAERTSDAPFTLVRIGSVHGLSATQAAERVRPYAEYGLDWWLEAIDPFSDEASWSQPWPPGAIDEMKAQIRQGPPRL